MTILLLALKDLKFEKLLSFCVIASLLAVICPLLIIFSLRFGILNNLNINLKSDPNNLSIYLLSSAQISKDTIDELAKRSDVDFIIGRARTLANTVNVKSKTAFDSGIDTLATKQGDLLWGKKNYNLANNEAIISYELAQKLKLKVNDSFDIYVFRIIDNTRQSSKSSFIVKDIIANHIYNKKAIFLNEYVTNVISDYVDGYDVDIFAKGTYKTKSYKDYYQNFRLYAKDLDSVGPLTDFLSQKYNVFSNFPKIKEVQQITHVLDIIFLGIALPCIVGGVIAFCGLIISLINKKKQSYALLRLSGLSIFNLYTLVVFEAVLLSIIAFILSLLLFYTASLSFNYYFAPFVANLGAVSTLEFWHIAIFFAFSIALSMLTSFTCAYIYLKVPLQYLLRMV